MNFYSLGITDDLSSYVKGKTKLSNQMAIMSAFIGGPYAIFTYFFYPPLLIYPSMAFVLAIVALALNHFGFLQFSRFLTSFQMLTWTSLFHASILQSGDPFLMPIFCSMIAMTLIPWLLYDFREKGQLIVSLIICYGLLIGQGVLNDTFVFDVDVTFFRESFLNTTTYVFTLVMTILMLVLLKSDKSAVEAS